MSVVRLTEPAASKVLELRARDGGAEAALRIKVIGGGCSGLQYQLYFDSATEDMDHDQEKHGVRLLVDAKSAIYLAGATVDYVDDLNGSGFRIENPNATSTCGCGESFGV